MVVYGKDQMGLLVLSGDYGNAERHLIPGGNKQAVDRLDTPAAWFAGPNPNPGANQRNRRPGLGSQITRCIRSYGETVGVSDGFRNPRPRIHNPALLTSRRATPTTHNASGSAHHSKPRRIDRNRPARRWDAPRVRSGRMKFLSACCPTWRSKAACIFSQNRCRRKRRILLRLLMVGRPPNKSAPASRSGQGGPWRDRRFRFPVGLIPGVTMIQRPAPLGPNRLRLSPMRRHHHLRFRRQQRAGKSPDPSTSAESPRLANRLHRSWSRRSPRAV